MGKYPYCISSTIPLFWSCAPLRIPRAPGEGILVWLWSPPVVVLEGLAIDAIIAVAPSLNFMEALEIVYGHAECRNVRQYQIFLGVPHDRQGSQVGSADVSPHSNHLDDSISR